MFFFLRNGRFRLSVALLATMAICLVVGQSPASSQETHAAEGHTGKPADSVQIQIKNVNLLLTGDIVLAVRELQGKLESTKHEVPVTFDDSDSFFVEADNAEIAISPASLTALMNSYVFADEGSPLKHLTVSIAGNRLIQKGTVHKGIDLPFEVDGSLSATEDGRVRVHADSIKSAHLPVKGLLHFLGEDLSKLIHDNQGRGIEVEGDDILLAPERLTPAPHIHGRVRRVDVADGKLTMIFDSGRRLPPLKPPLPSNAYIYHRGGVLRFGRLTMTDADLEIVGDRSGPFNFFQREYKKQLVGGYSKNTAANGLVAHMLDYSHFESHRPSADGNSKTSGSR